MKILVTAKRIPDPDEALKWSAQGLDTSSARFVPNAFDEYAVETALRLAEHVGTTNRLAEVVVLSVCPKDQRQHVTQFLAMGADRAILVDLDDTAADTQTIAKLIAAVFTREKCDLLVCGKLSQDNEGNQVGQRVAGLLDLPQATFAGSMTWEREQGALTVGREVDDGVETKRVPLPAVVSVDLRIVLPHSVKNQATPETHAYQEGPRLASLRGITMAKRKQVDVLTPADLGIAPQNAEVAAAITAPPARAPGQKVASVAELVAKLETEAKVL